MSCCDDIVCDFRFKNYILYFTLLREKKLYFLDFRAACLIALSARPAKGIQYKPFVFNRYLKAVEQPKTKGLYLEYYTVLNQVTVV